MKLKQKQSIRAKNAGELDTMIQEKRTAIAKATLVRAEGKNTNVLRALQHELAFMLTVRGEAQ
ncbi:hypothetical protein A3B56_01250 [Candidatus Roizmanbacteria bacterium RIFCSPLOWO2_01_FULL_45_11]|uniref:50S ribosomal protein L29 n=1 Tax=Candidatus Roizmanbacteria bacterium RIFCSPLOWO2_01_FULL_45_11 TaxID=1802070 RepID=A0A1F7JD86_9BACT|nr:MAG: hypothetical protein A3B56_01250 [Candidatus Roizmanbacteria bacterium RIFCSPLOWO2_01_FULL_45_11]